MEENNSKEIILTQEGYDKLESELELLKTTRRKEVAERLKVAISFGDLSENAEYDEAKNEQAQLEERISKLENILRTAVIVDESKLEHDVVNIGSWVKLDYEGEIEEYTIVGSAESDPSSSKISNEAPIGKALMGRREGESIEVQVPNGVVNIKILEVRR